MLMLNFDKPFEQFTTPVVKDIISQIESYAEKHSLKNVFIRSIEDSTWSDPVNQRYDIDIQYQRQDDTLVHQLLLFMKGELIDGDEFHRRYKEYYPEKV